MIKKILFGLLMILLLPISFLTFSSDKVQAEETDLSITIVKYKITDSKQTETFPVDGTKAEVGSDGLTPLAGISYVITRVSPVQETTDFQPVEGADAFSTTITTDGNGLAKVSHLAQGTYRVEEQSNSLLSKVMEPVILELPLPQRSGPALNEVYLYPKSSVIDTKVPSTGTKTGGGNTASGRLPQTSGNIGTYLSLIMILGFLMIMGMLGLWTLRKKNHYK
ncbi:pilin N-terminal domain-containing protein [Enterococcus sp. AZ072]|uniref:pilin N-terminal domain-containing protein n=1 Tax=unclassified Enterococcus TaxID=2608891 RepID=UPI003D2A7CB6